MGADGRVRGRWCVREPASAEVSPNGQSVVHRPNDSLLEDELGDREDQVGVLRSGDELPGRDPAEGGMLPAQ
jgi:hypothetical protein